MAHVLPQISEIRQICLQILFEKKGAVIFCVILFNRYDGELPRWRRIVVIHNHNRPTSCARLESSECFFAVVWADCSCWPRAELMILQFSFLQFCFDILSKRIKNVLETIYLDVASESSHNGACHCQLFPFLSQSCSWPIKNISDAKTRSSQSAIVTLHLTNNAVLKTAKYWLFLRPYEMPFFTNVQILPAIQSSDYRVHCFRCLRFLNVQFISQYAYPEILHTKCDAIRTEPKHHSVPSGPSNK